MLDITVYIYIYTTDQIKHSIQFQSQSVNFWLRCFTHIEHKIIVELFHMSLDPLNSGIVVCAGGKVTQINTKKMFREGKLKTGKNYKFTKDLPSGPGRGTHPQQAGFCTCDLQISNIRLCWKANKVDKVNNLLSILASKVLASLTQGWKLT